VPDVVTGWWIDDGTNVVASERFEGGVTVGFAAPGSFLTLTAILPFQTHQVTS